ncbi:MAG: response regulator transcription factor [Lewinellaceae bacterium]|nr:response regulator transcription factor [Saprospiraceae bacterium]MCB9339337.1 response regulator transcription factor [Lewinellaceae bacterium]
MNLLRCLVVDDEELARTLLENYIGRLPHLELVGQCKDPLEAMQVLQTETVDLLFLDIQMPGLTGVEFLRTLKTKPIVIFTTAYPDYAIEGYSLDVTDYLLKPFSFERFVQSVNKATELLRLKNGAPPATRNTAAPTAQPVKDFILVKSEHKIHRIKYDDILYIESMREYVAYYTPNGRILSLGSLKGLEEELPSDRFLRTHKSYIVALDKIETLEGNLLHIGKQKLPIGASYRDVVLARIFQ